MSSPLKLLPWVLVITITSIAISPDTWQEACCSAAVDDVIQINGRVVNETGAGLGGATLSLKDGSGVPVERVYSDNNGSFSINTYGVGDHQLLIVKDQYFSRYLEVLISAEDIEMGDIALVSIPAPSVHVQGVLKYTNGTPATETIIVRTEDERGFYVRTIPPDTRGRFSFSIFPGTFSFSVSVQGNELMNRTEVMVEEGSPYQYEMILDDLISDIDGDGMPAWFEEMNGLDDGNPQDASLDPDDDGLSNLEEFQNGTSPDDDDTDGDGLPDLHEVMIQGLDPRIDDGDGDLDKDGLSNIKEFLIGSDPTDPTDPGETGIDDELELLLLLPVVAVFSILLLGALMLVLAARKSGHLKGGHDIES